MSDTNPEAEQVQIELLRRAGPIRRLKIVMSLNNTVRRLFQQNLAHSNPTSNEMFEVYTAEDIILQKLVGIIVQIV